MTGKWWEEHIIDVIVFASLGAPLVGVGLFTAGLGLVAVVMAFKS